MTADINGSVTIDFSATVRSGTVVEPTSNPEPPTHKTGHPTEPAGGNGFTFFNLDIQLVPGRTVQAFTVYSDAAFSGVIKVGEQNSIQDWDIRPERDVTINHPGGGWASFPLATPWTIPPRPPSGDFFLGLFTSSGTYERVQGSRIFRSGDVSGNGQGGFTVDSGPAPAIGYVYGDTPVVEQGGSTAQAAALNWEVPAQEHPGVEAGVISAVVSAVTHPPHSGGMAVDFIDVSRTDWGGDSTLILAPNGEAVLVDAGSPTMGAVAIIPHLQRRGVERLKALFITHQHVDHIGGAAEILDRFPVDHLYVPDVPSGNFASFDQIMWNDMIAKANEKSVPVTVVTTPSTPGGSPFLSFGGVNLFVMQAYEITLRIEWAQSSVLLLADAPNAQLNDLVASNWDLSASLIKNAHHGIGDGGFATMLGDFQTDTHVGNFPQRLLSDANARAEGQAIEAAGRDYFIAAKSGTISAKFSSDGTKQISSYFIPYAFDLYHGRHVEEIYGSTSPAIYDPTWAS